MERTDSNREHLGGSNRDPVRQDLQAYGNSAGDKGSQELLDSLITHVPLETGQTGLDRLGRLVAPSWSLRGQASAGGV